ncbi:MAG: hypothetical protein OXG03_01705 [Gammaproteobacteria bacterium]|nr:hypothetical protein [Gammaproteobacteria bacterium]
MKFIFTLKAITVALLPAVCHGETWECWLTLPESGSRGQPDVMLTSDHGAGSGTITASGLPVIETSYGLQGLKRRWDWMNYKGSFAFTVKPYPASGYLGAYYEFRALAETKPNLVYFCKLDGIATPVRVPAPRVRNAD